MNLRGTAEVFDSPLSGPGVPEGPFSIFETRLRSSVSRAVGLARITLEVEAKWLQTTSGAGSFGRAQGGGSPLGRVRPLERFGLDWTQVNSPTTLLATRIERLDALGTFGRFDWQAGRQPITLGTSRYVSVLDVLAPFAPGDLDSTYKPGVDAVRLRRGFGALAEGELILAGAAPWSESAAIGRFRLPLEGIDVELLTGRFRRRWFGGMGWEGDAGPFGVWGELALFGRRPKEEVVRGWSAAAFSGVVGAEAVPWVDTRLSLSLLYQDFGVRDPSELPGLAVEAPFREGWVHLGSQAYLVPTFHRELHPLVQADLSGLVNLVDGSTLWQPAVVVSLHDEIDLTAFLWLGLGEGPDAFGVPRSEFGSTSDGGGLYARWFF